MIFLEASKAPLVALVCFLFLSVNHDVALAAIKPVGIHLDIEPHSLPGWNPNGGATTDSIANDWLDLLEKIQAETGAAIGLTVDFAMQYSSVVTVSRGGETKSVADHALDIVDNVVLMAYRDYGVEGDCVDTNHGNCDDLDSIRFHSQELLDVSQGRGISVKIGVETNPTVLPDKVTFGQEGEVYMERVLQDTVEHFLPNPDFNGIVVHDFVHATDDSFTDASLRDSHAERYCRSVWMWDDRYILNKDGLSPEALVPILYQHSIDNIIVDSRWFFESLKDQFRTFVDVMGVNGISVELLLAQHDWSLAENHNEVIGIVRDAVAFIQESDDVVGEHAGQCRLIVDPPSDVNCKLFKARKPCKKESFCNWNKIKGKCKPRCGVAKDMNNCEAVIGCTWNSKKSKCKKKKKKKKKSV